MIYFQFKSIPIRYLAMLKQRDVGHSMQKHCCQELTEGECLQSDQVNKFSDCKA